MKSRWFALTAVLVVLTAMCAAQSSQAAPQTAANSTPTITKETRLVLVDTVVTDKKGNYITDLTAKDFRVWEDNKEQPIKSFSFERDASGAADRRRYLVLFFDNSTMDINDQARARDAALKFLEKNTGSNRYIAIVDFGGTLRITQNFTNDAARLKDKVRNLKFSSVAPTPANSSPEAVPSPAPGIPQLVNAEADFGVRTLLLALRNMAKGLAAVPGRKSMILFSSGFPMDPADPNTIERESELTAAIDACNKANVAVYPIDVRGLITPIGLSPERHPASDETPKLVTAALSLSGNDTAPARLVYVQRGGGGGGRPTGGTGGHSTGSTGAGRGGNVGGARVGTPVPNPMPVAPYSQSRSILPTVQDISNNQQVLYQLAIGTGGFVIVNSNDLLGGIEKIAQEQNQYYVLSYTPPESPEGTCHTLRVKVERGNTVVRSRSGYCNARPTDLLAGKPIEKQLEAQATGSQMGNVAATMLAPYFYTSANVARVDLAIEIPPSAIKFTKEKGKQHAEINVLGLAYKPDGSIGARFSDNVEFNFDSKDEVEEFQKKPYRYEDQFEIAAGQYQLKVVFSSGGESLGKLQMPLTVDTYDAKKLSMSAVAFSKELHPLNQAGTSLDAVLLEDHVPLVSQGMQIVPAGTDNFKKTDMAVFYVEVYEPLLIGENPPKVGIKMQVLDRKTGEKKVDTGGPVPTAKAGDPVVPIGLRLPLDKLPPGSYQLELRALDSAGNSTPVRTADFVVE